MTGVPRSRSPKTQRAPLTLTDVCTRRKTTIQELVRESGARSEAQVNALCAALGCLYPSPDEMTLALSISESAKAPELPSHSVPEYTRVQWVESPTVETREIPPQTLTELPKRRGRKPAEETPPQVSLEHPRCKAYCYGI